MQRVNWKFKKGIYGSKDVPIRLLDKIITGMIGLVVVMSVLFAINGGFTVSFETGGGSEVAEQKLRHGKTITKPQTPTRPGYEFVVWVTSKEERQIIEKKLEETEEDHFETELFLSEVADSQEMENEYVWDFEADIVEGDMTLYAVWERTYE